MYKDKRNISNRVFGTILSWLVAVMLIGMVNTADDPNHVIAWSFKAILITGASWGTKAIWEIK